MRVKSRTFLALLSGCVSLILITSPTTHAADWRQSGFGAGHAGFNPRESTLDVANVGHVRRVFTVLVPDPVTSEVIVADGVAYFSAGPRAYAVDAATGESLWSAESCDGAAPRQPAYQSGSIWFGDEAGYLTGLDAKTGRITSCRRFAGAIFQIAVARGSVFVQDSAGDLGAIAAGTGAILWQRDRVLPSSEGVAAPAVANGLVYAIARKTIAVVNASTGSTLYSKVLPISTFISPVLATPVVAGSHLFVVANQRLFALDASTSSLLWRSPAYCCPTLPSVANGLVYVGAQDPVGGIHALRTGTGKAVIGGAGDELFSQFTLAKGVLYLCLDDFGEVQIWDAATGAFLTRRMPARGYCTGPPTVVNGTIYQPASYGWTGDDWAHGAVDAWRLPIAG